MTRRFNTTIKCPCGRIHTVETPFERWMRNEPALDSVREGIVRFDLDILHHQYKRKEDKKGQRDIQCMMFVEVKTYGAKPTEAQEDTLSLFAQVLRNRRPNKHQGKLGLHATDHIPLCRAFSRMLGKEIGLRLFGGHLLTLSGDSPANSEWMTWDNKPINKETLIGLLRFDIDPLTLRRIDWRRRTYTLKQLDAKGPLLPGIDAA